MTSAANRTSTTPVGSGALARGLLHFARLRMETGAEALVASVPWEPHPVDAPSAQAAAFRHVRDALGPETDWRRPAPDSTIWFRPAVPEYVAQLERFRGFWDERQSEILELHFGRMLEPEEIAHVLSAEASDIVAVIDDGLARGRALFGDSPPSRSADLAGALLEAFAPAHGIRDSRLPDDAAPLEVGAVLDQRYEIEAYLGGGAHADVYRARDRYVRDHVVALKISKVQVSSDVEREHALREIRCLASVFHPSIAHLKDHGWHEDRLWMVMPLYRGETLAERLARGPLGREEATRVFEALAEGLAAIHAVGVRHQDVKPENIMLAELGGARESKDVLPVLIDFGVAVSGDDRFLAGTPDYAAPEIAAGALSDAPSAPLTDRADVFSLALCLRDALSPECRAMTELSGESLEALLRRRATQPSQLPPERGLRDLDPCFERWLSLDPKERPTAAELTGELDVLLEPERRRARRRRRVRWLLNGFLLSALVVGSIAWNLHQRAETHRAEAAVERERATRASRRAELAEGELEEESRVRQQLEQRVTDLWESDISREEVVRQLAEARETIEALEADKTNLGVENNRLRRSNDDLQSAYRRLRDDASRRARAAEPAGADPTPPEAAPPPAD